MTPEDVLFGKIALKNKLVSQEQVEECIRIRKQLAHRKEGANVDLGTIILKKGYINEKQYRAIVRTQKAKLGKRKAEKAGGKVAEGTPASLAKAAMAARGPAQKLDSGKQPVRVAPELPGLRGIPDADRYGPGRKVLQLLKWTKDIGASDLHLSCGARPFVRLHGKIIFLDLPVLEPEENARQILDAFPEIEQSRFRERNDLDTCLHIEGLGRFRSNVLKQRRGVSAVFRVIKDRVPTLEELNLPKTLEKFTTYHQGIVLVTGPAGSGKSSTLAALIEIINRERKEHIITLEDPIEFIFDCRSCNISQRQVERHTASWPIALRAALREDPDVIMVGEMRDLETVSLAITSAETGHLVLGTLHTTNASRTVDRILDVFPPKEQAQIRTMVSESLRGVISQQLVPRADGRGRVPALEILFTTPAVSNIIRERRTFQLFSVLQTGKKLGMKLMDESLKELVQDGIITKEDARFRATNPRIFD
jgi:twitching motility protein PilT